MGKQEKDEGRCACKCNQEKSIKTLIKFIF